MNVLHRTPLVLVVALSAVLGLAACGSDTSDGAGTTTVDSMSDPTSEPPAETDPPGDSTADPTSSFTATPIAPDNGLSLPPGDDIDPEAAIVQGAVTDLAERLDVDVDEVEVLAARAVTWPDSSLGCPEPGMQYLQRMTDGALVVLEADGRRYQYHGGSPLVLCEHPAASFTVD